jgi:hypothetical protein
MSLSVIIQRRRSLQYFRILNRPDAFILLNGALKERKKTLVAGKKRRDLWQPPRFDLASDLCDRL